MEVLLSPVSVPRIETGLTSIARNVIEATSGVKGPLRKAVMNSDASRRRDVTVADVAKAAQVSKAQAARALGINFGDCEATASPFLVKQALEEAPPLNGQPVGAV